MRFTKYLIALLAGAALLAGGMQTAQAALFADAAELPKYLVIAIGDDNDTNCADDGSGCDGNKFEAFNMSNTELGADQEVLSKAGSGHPARVGSLPLGSVPSLFDVFAGTPGAVASFTGNRWDDTDHAGDGNGQTAGVPDRLPGARPIFEGIDFRGNVAIAGVNASFNASNTDTNGTFGIRCRTAGCNESPSSNNTYFDDSAANIPAALSTAVSTFTLAERTALNTELTTTRDFIVAMATDTVFSAATYAANGSFWANTTGEGTAVGSFSAALEDRNIKDSNAVVMTDLDALDINNDGFAVIDINVGGDSFNLDNTDWILKSIKETVAIFRLTGNADQFNFANSSILLGDGVNTRVIDEIGAIFFSDAIKDTNQVFALSNVILGGVALWDFIDYNARGVDVTTGSPPRPVATRLYDADGAGVGSVKIDRPGALTEINMQNAQGCGQFISHEVNMSNNRWSGCTQVARIPEPSAWLIIGLGVIGIEIARRSRRVMRAVAA